MHSLLVTAPRQSICLALMCASTMVLNACTPALTGSNFGRNEVRVINEVYYGTIKHLRTVNIDGANTGQGTAAGAASGALAGNTFGGSGVNQAFATIGGGLLGGIVGSGAEEKISSSRGLEMLIVLEGGRPIAIVQQPGRDQFSVGQRVRVMSANGYSRVVPDQEDQ